MMTWIALVLVLVGCGCLLVLYRLYKIEMYRLEEVDRQINELQKELNKMEARVFRHVLVTPGEDKNGDIWP